MFAATCKDSVGPKFFFLRGGRSQGISEFSYSPFEVEDAKFYVDNPQKANLCRVLCLSFFQFQNVDIGENCASFRVFVVFFPLLQPSEALWGLCLEYFSA